MRKITTWERIWWVLIIGLIIFLAVLPVLRAAEKPITVLVDVSCNDISAEDWLFVKLVKNLNLIKDVQIVDEDTEQQAELSLVCLQDNNLTVISYQMVLYYWTSESTHTPVSDVTKWGVTLARNRNNLEVICIDLVDTFNIYCLDFIRNLRGRRGKP